MIKWNCGWMFLSTTDERILITIKLTLTNIRPFNEWYPNRYLTKYNIPQIVNFFCVFKMNCDCSFTLTGLWWKYFEPQLSQAKVNGRRQNNWKQMTGRERFVIQTTQGDEKTADRPPTVQKLLNGQRNIHNNVNVIKIQYQSELILFEVRIDFFFFFWEITTINPTSYYNWIERSDNNEWLDDGPNVDNLLRFNMLFVGSKCTREEKYSKKR